MKITFLKTGWSYTGYLSVKAHSKSLVVFFLALTCK